MCVIFFLFGDKQYLLGRSHDWLYSLTGSKLKHTEGNDMISSLVLLKSWEVAQWVAQGAA